MNLLTQNTKIKETGNYLKKKVFNFSIPAYKSETGKVTCPFADSCIKFCYAQKIIAIFFQLAENYIFPFFKVRLFFFF